LTLYFHFVTTKVSETVFHHVASLEDETQVWVLPTRVDEARVLTADVNASIV